MKPRIVSTGLHAVLLLGLSGSLSACLTTVDQGADSTSGGSFGKGSTNGSGTTTGPQNTTGSGTAGGPQVCPPPCGANESCTPQATGPSLCECYPSFTKCNVPGGFVCSNPYVDSSNCGNCGHACDDDQRCLSGVCVCALTTCVTNGGTLVCIDPITDDSNCGSCNHPCDPGTSCHGGTCK